MPGMGRIEPTQLLSLGETPAEARKRMESSGSGAKVEQPQGMEVEGPLTPAHLAAIEAEEGGFKDTGRSDGPPQELEDLEEPPTPSKAMETIRQLSQEKNQAVTERDAALNKVARYEAVYGELD